MYQIEPLSEQNLHHLIHLYQQVFGKVVDLPYLQKKYNTSYLGHSYFGHLAMDDQHKAVAYYGAVAFKMVWQNQEEIAAQSGDAMTLEEHTGKGLFTQLGEKTDEQLVRAGIRFVWGFPNQNSEYGYVKKLHWQYKDRMLAFKFPVKTIPWEAVSRHVPLTKTWFQKRIKQILGPLEVENATLPSSVAVENFGGTSRDLAFFQYKSFSDNFIIELRQRKIWIKVNFGLWVGDLEIMPEKEFDDVLDELKVLAGKLGLREVGFQFSPGTYYGQLLTKKYKPMETWVAGYKNYDSAFPLENLKFSWGDLDTF